jgi:hypothetical protein
VGVVEWLYKEPHLILVFVAKDRARWALESQRQATMSYPSKPLAQALPYVEGQCSYWSKGALARHDKTVELRQIGHLDKYPPPELI